MSDELRAFWQAFLASLQPYLLPIVEWLSIQLCGLRGHDALLKNEAGRLSLRCVSCPYESPGWDLRGRDPRPPARSRIDYRPPMIVESRRCQ